MRPNLQRQSGLSLIELMVAITAGTIVVFAVSSLLISTLSANSTNMRYTRINQDLRSALVAVSKDLARAGEWILADDIVHASVTSDLLLSGTSGSVTATALQPGSVTTTNVFSFSNAANALTNRTMVILMKNAGVNTRYNLTITGVPSQNSLTLTIPTGTTLPSNKILANSWTIVNPFIGIVVNGANNCVISSYDLDADGVRDSNENFAMPAPGRT
jgi:Tfp pilus assembly protein PilV